MSNVFGLAFWDSEFNRSHTAARPAILEIVAGNRIRLASVEHARIDKACVFVDGDERDIKFACVFVEDAEEDAKTIGVLWKTLRKTLKALGFCGRR